MGGMLIARAGTMARPFSGTYASEVIADSPSLYWRLGESSGTTAHDETANNRDGIYGAGVTLGTTGALAGDSNTAVTFNGANNARIRSTYNPFTTGAALTFEGWAWRDNSAAGNYDALFSGDAAANAGPACYLEQGSQNVRFVPIASGSENVWVGAWPGNAQWVHWVVTFDDASNTAELFINAVSKGTRTETETYGGTPGSFQVGALRDVTDPMLGRFDEIAVYPGLLSPARIAAHYDAGT